LELTGGGVGSSVVGAAELGGGVGGGVGSALFGGGVGFGDGSVDTGGGVGRKLIVGSRVGFVGGGVGWSDGFVGFTEGQFVGFEVVGCAEFGGGEGFGEGLSETGCGLGLDGFKVGATVGL